MTYSWRIYKITNPNGRMYVGVTRNWEVRMNQYKNNKCISQKLLNRSISKYGFSAHEVSIIEEFHGSVDDAMSKEMFWIRSFMTNSYKWRGIKGMNLTDGGEGTLGHKLGKKAIKRLSEAGKRPENVERLKKINIGRTPHNKGKKSELSDGDRKLFYGARNLGNKYNLGRKRPLTDEQKIMRMKPVMCYDSDGNFISEYRSIKDAAQYTGLFTTQIGSSLRGTYKNGKGLVFKYKNDSVCVA